MTSKHLLGGVSALGLVLAATLGATTASATEGYFQTGYGTIQKAESGAGVANPEDAMTLSVNPAGLVSVGRQFEVAFTLFAPHRGYSAEPMSGMGAMGPAPGKYDSNIDVFLMPNMAYSAPIDAQSAWGVAVFGNGGMNTDYHVGVFGAGNTGVNLEQMFLTVGYARKMGDLSIGLAPVIAMQKFRADGLEMFDLMGLSTHSGHVSGNGDDYSYGAGFRAGLQWDLTKTLRFGLSGQTPIWSTKFDKYSGLFADGGSFDIPASITAGFAWDALPNLTLMADYRHIFYSGVKAISNSSMNIGYCMMGDASYCLGGSNGAGFGWHDIDVIALAAAYKVTPDLTLRAGYSHNTNPIHATDVMFNILAPGVVTDHISGGLSYNYSKNLTIDLAGAFVPEQSVTGYYDEFGDKATIKMYQWEASLGIRYRY